MSSSYYNQPVQCCDGSFEHAFQGPVGGFVPMLLTAMSCAPVIILMVKIARGTQLFDLTILGLEEEAHNEAEVEMRAVADDSTSKKEGRHDTGVTQEDSLELEVTTAEEAQEAPSDAQDKESQDQDKVVSKSDEGDQNAPRVRGGTPLPTRLRNQLLLSGLAKLATRFYAGLYASAAAGSAHICDPHASSVINVCLNAGYGYEAFVLGYSGIAAGILDWMTLVRSELPIALSLSSMRWEVINNKGCACCESIVLGVLLFLLAIVGAGGHILSAEAEGLTAAILIGIYAVVGAGGIICGLVPFICCNIGLCNRMEGETGYVLARNWELVRMGFLEIPGLIIGFLGNGAAVVGWIIDILDSGIDFFFDHQIGCGD